MRMGDIKLLDNWDNCVALIAAYYTLLNYVRFL